MAALRAPAPTLVQVHVSGVDPKGVKRTYAAFHTFCDGRTTLSTSGLLLWADAGPASTRLAPLAIAPITALYPFLHPDARPGLVGVDGGSSSSGGSGGSGSGGSGSGAAALLLPDTRIELLVQAPPHAAAAATDADASAPRPPPAPAPHAAATPQQLLRLPATLLATFSAPALQLAADDLLTRLNAGSTTAPAASWQYRWALAGQQPAASASAAAWATWALLQPLPPPALQQQLLAAACAAAPPPPLAPHGAAAAAAAAGQQPPAPRLLAPLLCTAPPSTGRPLQIQGCPFGALAPLHFHGTCIQGHAMNAPLPPPQHHHHHHHQQQQQQQQHLHQQQQQQVRRPVAAAPGPSPTAPGDGDGGSSTRRRAACPCCPGDDVDSGSGGSAWLMVMVDAATPFPGMEGGWVTCGCCRRWVGLLAGPLCHAASRVEVPLAVAAAPLLAAAQHALLRCSWRPEGAEGSAPPAAAPRLPGPAAPPPPPTQLVPGAAGGRDAQVLVAPAPARAASAPCPPPTPPPPQQQQQLAGPCCCTSGSCGAAGAAAAVVAVRVPGSWASGVLVTPGGLLVTNAHLFDPPGGAKRGAGQRRAPSNERDAGSSSSSSHARQRPPGPAAGGGGGAAAEDEAGSGARVWVRLSAAGVAAARWAHAAQGAAGDADGGPAFAPSSSSSSSDSGGGAPGLQALLGGWLPARLLHRFRSHLDLAVLQLLLPGPAAPRPPLQLRLPSLRLAPPAAAAAPQPGAPVAVVGHGVFGPGTGLGPSVTWGASARVVLAAHQDTAAAAGGASGAVPPSPRPGAKAGGGGRAPPCDEGDEGPQQQQQRQPQPRPVLLISTAAVHAGASGGAVVCPATGALLGLVTSNARHVSGATLPHLNFSIPAAALAPVWGWAAQHEQLLQHPGQAAAAARSLAALRLLDEGSSSDAVARRIWALQPLDDGGAAAAAAAAVAAAAAPGPASKL